MRVVKDDELGLLTNLFGIKDKFYFVVSTLIFFDFEKPDTLLTEQDMWKCIPEQLGDGEMLDMAMAKPNAEFLVCGDCFSPEGTTRNASEVKVRVGSTQKALNVMGDRYWKDIGGTKIISEAVPFSQIPINWKTAFGGVGFTENELGKGAGDVLDTAGKLVKLLPNIEDPKNMVGLVDDRPNPVSFFHHPISASHRQKKLGTYNDQWFRERWPYFPIDMDYSYYNAAPQDQIIDGFFKGDESIEILNMNPKHQLIQTKLPSKRIRCFFQQNEKCEIKDENLIFKEIETKLDTVWLFPSAMKGVCIYRGTTEVIDEELFDVFRLNIVAEELNETPKSKEHYLEVLRKKIDKVVKIDTAPFQDAKKQIAIALKEAADIPKSIEDIKQGGLGNAPVAHTTPEQKTQDAKKVMQASIDLFKKGEQKMIQLKSEFGHIMKIDPSIYAKAAEKMKLGMVKMDKLAKSGRKVLDDADDILKRMSENTKKMRNIELEKRLNLDVEDINFSIYPKEWTKWTIEGHKFVSTCWYTLRQGCDHLTKLQSLGISKRIINKALFGYNSEPFKISNEKWGFEENTEEIIIPVGFIMPYYEGAILKRIRILPNVQADESEGFIVPGSIDTPLSVGLDDSKAAVAVEKEIEAWKLFSEIDDFAGTITLASADISPSDIDAEKIKNTPIYLKVLPKDEIKAKAIMADGWLDAGLTPMLLEKESNIFDAEKEGVNLEMWVYSHIPEGLFDEPIKYVDMEDDGPGIKFKLPQIDIKGIMTSIHSDLQDKVQGKEFDVTAMDKETKDKFVELYKTRGKDPAEIEKLTAHDKSKPFEFMNKGADKLREEREKLKKMDALTPDKEKQMLDFESKLRKDAVIADQQYKDGMAKLADLKAKKPLSGMEEMDTKITNMKAQLGIPLDSGVKVEGMESLKFKLENGESLKGVDLTGYDFTEMDLSDTDFSGAILNDAIFNKAILNNTNFKDAVCSGTDFSNVTAKNTDYSKVIFNKAKLTDADFTEANFNRVIFNACDLSKTTLSFAKMEHCTFNNSILIGVVADEIEGKNIIFEKSQLNGSRFYAAKIPNATFSNTELDEVDFSNMVGKALTFWKTKGENIKFNNAEIPSIRIVEENHFNNINFQNAHMKKACITDAEMQGAVFTGCMLENAMLERNNLQNSDFSRVNAKFARFNRSDMRNSNLKNMNIMQGSLRKVQLFGSDLSGTNLYSAELYKIKTGETKLDNVNFDMTKLENREDLIP